MQKSDRSFTMSSLQPRLNLQEKTLQIYEERFDSARTQLEQNGELSIKQSADLRSVRAQNKALEAKNKDLADKLAAERQDRERSRQSVTFDAERIYDLSSALFEREREIADLKAALEANEPLNISRNEEKQEIRKIAEENALLESQNAALLASTRAEVAEAEIERLMERIGDEEQIILSERNQLELLQKHCSGRIADLAETLSHTRSVIESGSQPHSNAASDTQFATNPGVNYSLAQSQHLELEIDAERLQQELARERSEKEALRKKFDSITGEISELSEIAATYHALKPKYDKLFIKHRALLRRQREIEIEAASAEERIKRAEEQQLLASNASNAYLKQTKQTSISSELLKAENRALAAQNTDLLEKLNITQVEQRDGEDMMNKISELQEQVRSLIRDKLGLTARIEMLEASGIDIANAP